MAKIMSTLVGQGKGKIGAEVLYRANGEQYLRARAISVANPQSNSQMYQRLAIVSAAKLSAQLQGIIDHSFESLPYGTKSVRYFNSLATRAFKAAIMHPTGLLKRYAPVLPKGAGYATAVDGLQISQGTLATPGIDTQVGIAEGFPSAFAKVSGIITGQTTVANLTLGQFLTAIGCELTDQLTFIFGVPVHEGVAYDSENEYGTILTEIIRVNFKSDAALTATLITNGGFNPAIIDADKSTNVDELALRADDEDLRIEFEPASGVVSLVSVIRSAFVGGSWRRSNAELHCSSRFMDEHDGAAVGLEVGMNSLPNVIATYRKTSSKVEDRFLNQEDNA